VNVCGVICQLKRPITTKKKRSEKKKTTQFQHTPIQPINTTNNRHPSWSLNKSVGIDFGAISREQKNGNLTYRTWSFVSLVSATGNGPGIKQLSVFKTTRLSRL
jgi:hypothetical protein